MATDTAIQVSAVVDGVEYVAKLDALTLSVRISQDVDPSAGQRDGRSYHVGTGRWDGSSIVDCGADLGDDVYEAIDAAISQAIESGGMAATEVAARVRVPMTHRPRYMRDAGDVVGISVMAPGRVALEVIADENEDDCLAAAVDAVSEYLAYPDARWTDDTRDTITVTGRLI